MPMVNHVKTDDLTGLHYREIDPSRLHANIHDLPKHTARNTFQRRDKRFVITSTVRRR